LLVVEEYDHHQLLGTSLLTWQHVVGYNEPFFGVLRMMDILDQVNIFGTKISYFPIFCNLKKIIN